MSALVRVLDQALPEPLFRRLAQRVRALGSERLRDTYQTTFWFDFGAPDAVAEEAVLALRAVVPELRASLRGGRRAASGLAGVEWWLSRMRTSDVRVDFHRDRDEVRVARTGRTVHPAISSVLFLNRCRGGWLAVADADPNPANPSCAPDALDADLVRPWPNRLAVFPGDATHGVLDAEGRIPHGRLARPTALRLALVMNWWTRPPMGVPRFAPSGRYPALRTTAGVTGRASRRAPAASRAATRRR